MVCTGENTQTLCGLPGLVACAAGTACSNGGCKDATTGLCVADGANGSTAGQVCASGTFKACGAAGQPCCEPQVCGGGACCVNNTCVASGSGCGALTGTCSESELGGCGTCGGLGQPCCGTTGKSPFCTGAGLKCYSGSCQHCGGPGQPCCDGLVCLGKGCCISSKCVAPGGSCGTFNGSCAGGSCVGGSSSYNPCGGLGQQDCFSTHCTAPFTYYYSSSCESCGADSQKCCTGYWCGPGQACSGTSSSSTCVTCGGTGQPCCMGVFCATGTCTGSTCS